MKARLAFSLLGDFVTEKPACLANGHLVKCKCKGTFFKSLIGKNKLELSCAKLR